MKKLFDNIKSLTLVKTTANGPMAATEMRSNEDEVVPFDGQVSLRSKRLVYSPSNLF
jgi:hypothetical protein